MTSEVALLPSVLFPNSNEQVLNFRNDPLRFQVPRGVDIPQQLPHRHEFPFYASNPSSFPPECTSSDFTPSSVWSDSSFSPVLESSTCSTETDSNDEDNFMAGLAEQMAHFMLSNDEEEEKVSVPEQSPTMCRSNCLPFFTELGEDAEERNHPYWLTRGWQDRCWNSANCRHLSSSDTCCPLTSNEVPLHQLRYAGGSDVNSANVDTHSERVPSQFFKQPGNDQSIVSRKIEEFLWKQALKQQGSQMKNHLSTDFSAPCSDYAAGPYMHGISKPRNSSRARSPRSWKLREDQKRLSSYQGRYSKQSALPSWSRQSRPQQQANFAVQGRFNVHSRVSDQPCLRTPDSARGAWSLAPNLNRNSNMRALFLSGSANGRESAGTGVFLPRCAGITQDSKRKPACSTVLLPSRVVQVLNLQVDDLTPKNYYPHQFLCSTSPGTSTPSFRAAVTDNVEAYHHQEYMKSYSSSHICSSSQGQLEFSQGASNLPVDWTY